MTKILTIFFLVALSFGSFAQRDGFSANEYKEKYLNKRTSLLHSSTKNLKDEEQKILDDILAGLKDQHPGSYEYKLISYVNSGYNDAFKSNLFEAYEINKSDKDVLKYMLAYYIIHNDKARTVEFIKKIDDFYSKNQWDYYRDLLNGIDKGFILTSNHDDTYPLLAAQMLYSVGSDVEVICLDFLQNDTYKNRIQEKFGMKSTPFLGKEKLFVAELLKSSKSKVIVSTTVNQGYLAQVETNMYLTGLAYEYNCNDQRQLLENFWKRMQTRGFQNLTLSGTDRKLYINYLPPLLTLYRLKWQERKQDALLKKTIQLIAIKVKKETEVEEIIKQYESE